MVFFLSSASIPGVATVDLADTSVEAGTFLLSPRKLTNSPCLQHQNCSKFITEYSDLEIAFTRHLCVGLPKPFLATKLGLVNKKKACSLEVVYMEKSYLIAAMNCIGFN